MSEDRFSKYNSFIQSRRSSATRVSYHYGINSLVGDGETFLALAESDRAEAERVLMASIIKKRDERKVKGSTIQTAIMEVKSMLEFHDISFNWKKIRGVAPKGSYVALDRAPLKEEIRALLDKSLSRERAAILVMASGGIRVGSFEYLKVGHMKVLSSGIGALKVYADEPEEYTALISPEAVEAVRQYFHERESFGKEVLSDSSPFLRNLWDIDRPLNRIVKRYNVGSLQRELFRTWIRAEVRTNEHKRGIRKEFKAAHGFRKFAKTQLMRAGVSELDSEVLLGHRENYYKPTLEHLIEEYKKAIPFLTISETVELRTELVAKESGFEKERESWQTQLATLHSLVRDRDKIREENIERLEKEIEELREKR